MCLAIPVGFAMSRTSSEYAAEQMRLLTSLGEDGDTMREFEGYQFS